ncbi:MAG: sigma-70 family RNA polymerase sigma factor [bacterium]|nr:MAG: sigma-70 family RNA polymerase sigma factor [bacterium]
MKDLGDTELALLAKEGDVAAFEAIYDRHAPGIARALASYAGPDRDLLDDLTQEVFCRVIEGLPSFDPARPFSHWLYTVALNVGRNQVRRRSVVSFEDPCKLDGLPQEGNRITGLEDEVMAEVLYRLVSRLPEHMCEVVSLRIGSGMPYAEIGEMLGIPEGTARSRMHNAIGLLRDKLGIRVLKEEKG